MSLVTLTRMRCEGLVDASLSGMICGWRTTSAEACFKHAKFQGGFPLIKLCNWSPQDPQLWAGKARFETKGVGELNKEAIWDYVILTSRVTRDRQTQAPIYLHKSRTCQHYKPSIIGAWDNCCRSMKNAVPAYSSRNASHVSRLMMNLISKHSLLICHPHNVFTIWGKYPWAKSACSYGAASSTFLFVYFLPINLRFWEDVVSPPDPIYHIEPTKKKTCNPQ